MNNVHFDRSLIGEVINDEYVIEDLLGAGGMGTAYKAVHIRLRRKVCIKFLEQSALSDPASIRRFKREARILGNLNHPNIVTCYAFGTYRNVYPFLVMELLDGHSLREELREGAIDTIRACRIIEHICIGLQFAHNAGFAHRDIKPDNIMLCGTHGQEIVKLVDFGLARTNCQSLKLDTLTAPGDMLGTPLYMAPEIFAGDNSGKSADIYATGCLLYECLAGTPPFAAGSLHALMRQHSQDDPPPLPRDVATEATRKRLDAIIKRATEKDPEKRFREGGDLQRLLHLVPLLLSNERETSEIFDEELNLVSTHRSGGGSRRWYVAIVMCGIILLLVIAATHQTGRSGSARATVNTNSRLDRSFNRAKLNQLRRTMEQVRQSAHQTNNASTDEQILALSSDLSSYLHEFGSSRDFMGSVEGQQLLASYSALIPTIAQTDSNNLRNTFRGTYMDLLTCCGFYSRAADCISNRLPPVLNEFGTCGRATDLQRLHDLLQNKIKDCSPQEKDFLTARIRPLAPALLLEGDARRLMIITTLYAQPISDPWEPDLEQLVKSKRIGSKAQQGLLFCTLAQGAYNKGRNAESSKLFVEAGKFTTLEGTTSVVAAEVFCQTGMQQEALKLLEDASATAASANHQFTWFISTSRLIRLRAQDKQFTTAKASINEMFANKLFSEAISEAPRSKTARTLMAGGLTDLMDAITILAKTQVYSRQEFTSVVDRLTNLILVAGLPQHYIVFGSFVQWWRLDTPSVAKVVLESSRQLAPKIEQYGFLIARSSFQYALLSINRNYKDAVKYFQYGVQQSEDCISNWRNGDVVGGSEPLQRVLKQFDATNFAGEAARLSDKISKARKVRLALKKGNKPDRTGDSSSNGKDSTGRR